MIPQHKYTLEQIKTALLDTYAKDICHIGKTQIQQCNTIHELIDIYKYYQRTLVGEFCMSEDFFRTYLKDYRTELEEHGVFVDRVFTKVNPAVEDIILIGKCKMRLICSQTGYHNVIVLHQSTINVLLMEYAVCDISIADKSNVKIKYINEHARLTIICKKETITYPR